MAWANGFAWAGNAVGRWAKSFPSLVLADAEPTKLYPEGDGSFEFERTASRLQEMRSADWLEDL